MRPVANQVVAVAIEPLGQVEHRQALLGVNLDVLVGGVFVKADDGGVRRGVGHDLDRLGTLGALPRLARQLVFRIEFAAAIRASDADHGGNSGKREGLNNVNEPANSTCLPPGHGNAFPVDCQSSYCGVGAYRAM